MRVKQLCAGQAAVCGSRSCVRILPRILPLAPPPHMGSKDHNHLIQQQLAGPALRPPPHSLPLSRAACAAVPARVRRSRRVPAWPCLRLWYPARCVRARARACECVIGARGRSTLWKQRITSSTRTRATAPRRASESRSESRSRPMSDVACRRRDPPPRLDHVVRRRAAKVARLGLDVTAAGQPCRAKAGLGPAWQRRFQGAGTTGGGGGGLGEADDGVGGKDGVEQLAAGGGVDLAPPQGRVQLVVEALRSRAGRQGTRRRGQKGIYIYIYIYMEKIVRER